VVIWWCWLAEEFRPKVVLGSSDMGVIRV
jgi:hypothetical protein